VAISTWVSEIQGVVSLARIFNMDSGNKMTEPRRTLYPNITRYAHVSTTMAAEDCVITLGKCNHVSTAMQ